MGISQQESIQAAVALNSPKAQELLARAYALLNNSGLRAGLLKSFGKDLVEQIIGVLCIQYLMYIAVNEGMDDKNGWEEIIDHITPEMFDNHSEFVSISVAFYDSDEDFNTAKHPIDLKELDFGDGADADNSDLIKLIIFMFNRHSVSDAIYDKLSQKNKSLQLSKALFYTNAYVNYCQDNGTVSLYSILMNQAWIIGLHAYLTSSQKGDESKGVTQ